jgi:hypothetical protein
MTLEVFFLSSLLTSWCRGNCSIFLETSYTLGGGGVFFGPQKSVKIWGQSTIANWPKIGFSIAFVLVPTDTFSAKTISKMTSLAFTKACEGCSSCSAAAVNSPA